MFLGNKRFTMDYVENVIGISFQKIMMEIRERDRLSSKSYTKEISHSPEKQGVHCTGRKEGTLHFTTTE